jgi:hypothetical protein
MMKDEGVGHVASVVNTSNTQTTVARKCENKRLLGGYKNSCETVTICILKTPRTADKRRSVHEKGSVHNLQRGIKQGELEA